VALTSERILALKTALYHDAVKHDYVEKGFQIYKEVGGQIIGVPTVGIPCRTMIATYQKRHKLEVDGTFSTQTQTSLIPVPPKSGGDLVAEQAHRLINLAPTDYTQARPYPPTIISFKARGTDCSGSSILCFKLAGQPDPNGTNFNGSGNTWSLIARGTHVSATAVKPGDLSFYGAHQGDPEHVVVELGGGYVMSDGHKGGPLLLRRSYRMDYLETRRYPTRHP
jgi:cell wall-associated NlpC family hydrolase